MSEQHESTATLEQATMTNYAPQLTRRCSAARIGRRTPRAARLQQRLRLVADLFREALFSHVNAQLEEQLMRSATMRSNSNEHYFRPSRE